MQISHQLMVCICFYVLTLQIFSDAVVFST